MPHPLPILALALLPFLPAQDPHTGAVGEAEFKAMHELKQGAAPALLGSAIELGGSKAYLSLPKSPRAGSPGVVLIHEWYGLNDHIKHWADRLASDGYAALAVDLYGGVVAKNSDEAMAAMKKVADEPALALMRAGEKFLREDARTKSKKVASLGWCFGGKMSLLFALNSPTLDACVLYYGRLEKDPAKLAALKAPLLGIFGSKDSSIPPADIAAFVEALVKNDKEHRVLTFHAVHAFANPSNAKYDEQSAAVAWENVRLFLAEKLK
jgi:carboxymethylenebutenolidase